MADGGGGSQTVNEIAVALTLDVSQFMAGIDTAKTGVQSIAAIGNGPAKGISAGRVATGYTEEGTRQARAGIAVPMRDVNRADYRAWRTSFSSHATKEPINVPVTVNVASVKAMRREIQQILTATPIPINVALSMGKNTGVGLFSSIIQSTNPNISRQQASSFARKILEYEHPPEKRATGGAVRPGVPYTVGENGRETFVPDRPGRIIPHGNVVPIPRISGGFTRDWRRQKNWRDAPRVENVRVSTLMGMRDIDRERWPRGGRDSGYLDQLTEDIRRNGIREPVWIDYDPQTHSSLLSEGNHRLAAARRLGLETVPAQMSVRQYRTLESEGYREGRVGRDLLGPQWMRLPGRRALPDRHGYIPNRLPPSWVGIRRRGGEVHGYGGQYGAAKPSSPSDFLRYQEMLWGEPSGEPGYLYHATPSIDPIRGKWGRRTGVIPTPQWSGMASFWSTRPESIYGDSLLRTPLTGDFTPLAGVKQYGSLHYTASESIGRPRLQYWGDDNRWHRFRRGRARHDGGPIRRAGAGPVFGGPAFYAGPSRGLREPYRPQPHIIRAMDEIRGKGWEHNLGIYPRMGAGDVWSGALEQVEAGEWSEEQIRRYIDKYYAYDQPWSREIALERVKNKPHGALKYTSEFGAPRDLSPRVDWLRALDIGDETSVSPRYKTPISIHSHPPTMAGTAGVGGRPGETYFIGRPSPADVRGFLKGEQEAWVVNPRETSILRRTDRTRLPYTTDVWRTAMKRTGAELGFDPHDVPYDWGLQSDNAIYDRIFKSLARTLGIEYLRFPTDPARMPEGVIPESRMPWSIGGYQKSFGMWRGGAVRALEGIKAYGYDLDPSILGQRIESYREISRRAAANPLSRVGGNIWYPGRRRAMLEEALRSGWLDTSSIGAMKRTGREVINATGLISPGLPDAQAVRWAHAVLNETSPLRSLPGVSDYFGNSPAAQALQMQLIASIRNKYSGLAAGRGYANIQKGIRTSLGETPVPWGISPKVHPFTRALSGLESALAVDSHHIHAGGITDAREADRAASVLKRLSGTHPTLERAYLLEASRQVQSEFSHIWPSMRRWQAGIWGEDFITGSKPQPFDAAYSNIVVPKGWRGRASGAGWKMGPGGLLLPSGYVPGRMAGGPMFRAVDPDIFHAAITSAAQRQQPSGRRVGETVHVYRPDEYAAMRTYLSRDMLTGYALKGEDLVSVFNVGGQGRGKSAVRSAIQRGAMTLDAFGEHGTYLASPPGMSLKSYQKFSEKRDLPGFYSRFGFREIAREPWNPDYAPEGWQGGTPDVVYMRRRPRRRADGGDVESIRTFLGSLKSLSKKFGHAPKMVGTYNAVGEKFGYAATPDTERIDINLGNIATLREKFPSLTAKGVWVPGLEPGTDPFQYIAGHEYGHLLENLNEEDVERFRERFFRGTLGVKDPWRNRQPSLVTAIGRHISSRLGGAYPHGQTRLDALEPQLQRYARAFPSEYAYESPQDWLAETFAATQFQRPILRGDAAKALESILPGLKHRMAGGRITRLFPGANTWDIEHEDPQYGGLRIFRDRGRYIARDQATGEHETWPSMREMLARYSRLYNLSEESLKEVGLGRYIGDPKPRRRAEGGYVPVGMLHHMRLAEMRDDPWALMALTGEPNFPRDKKDKDKQRRALGGPIRRDTGGRARLARDFAGGPLSYILPMYHRYANDPESHRAWAEAMNPSNPARMLREAMMFRYWDQWPAPSGSMWSKYGEMGEPSFNPRHPAHFPARLSNKTLSWLMEQGFYGKHMGVRRHAAGGPESGHGLYIVGEVGDELFVPNRLAHVIPPHVMKQIPKRAEGGPAGIFKVGKRGQEYFTPPEDGWIIPHRLVDEVPHLAAGGEAHRDWLAEERDPETLMAAVDPSLIPQDDKSRGRRTGRVKRKNVARRGPAPIDYDVNYGQPTGPGDVNVQGRRNFRDVLQSKLDARAVSPEAVMALIGEADEKVESRKVTRGRFGEAPGPTMTPDADILRERFAGTQGYFGARNPKGFAAAIGSLGLGGGTQARQRAAEFQAASSALAKAEGAYNRQVRPLQQLQQKAEERIEYLTEERKTLSQGSTEYKTHTKAIEKLTDLHSGYTKELQRLEPVVKNYENARVEAAEKFAKTQPSAPGILRNFGAIIATTSAYGLAMQGIGIAMGVAEQAARPMVDSFMGWRATATKVTSQMGDLTKEAKGNVSAVTGVTAALAGMSKTSMALMGSLLMPSAQAKAGGQTALAQQETYRSMLAMRGGKAPEGLYGGYGGLFGSSFLASEVFGGGKGFMETVAGTLGSLATGGKAPTTTYRSPTGGAPSPGYFSTYPYTGVPAAATQEGMNAIPVEGQMPIQLDMSVTRAATKDLTEMTNRGMHQMGENAVQVKWELADSNAQFSDYLTNLNRLRDANELSADSHKFLYESARASGVVIKTLGGDIVRNSQTLSRAQQQMSIGATITPIDTVLEQSKWRLQAASYGITAQKGVERGTTIPFQTWMGALGQGYGAGPGGGFMSVAQRMGGAAAFGGTNISMGPYTGAPNMPYTSRLAEEGFSKMRQMVASQGGTRPAIDQRYGAGPVGEFDKLGAAATSLGTRIGHLSSAMAALTQKVALAQFANEMRLTKRALSDTLGFLGKPGGSRMGQIERQQFEIGQASSQLSINMERRSLATQAAMAAFATPGETGEERYARAMEALTEVKIKSQQVEYAQTGLGLTREATMIGKGREETDLTIQLGLIQMQRDATTQLAAWGQELADTQQELSSVGGLMQSIADESLSKFNLGLSTVVDAMATLGPDTGNFDLALRTVTEYMNSYVSADPLGLGEENGRGGGGTWTSSSGPLSPPAGLKYQLNPDSTHAGDVSPAGVVKTDKPLGATKPNASNQGARAEGYLGYHSTATTLTVGEAGGEQVAVLRNPSQALLPPQGQQQNGPIQVAVNINGTTVRNENDIQALAQRVAYEVERILGRKSQLTGVRGPSF